MSFDAWWSDPITSRLRGASACCVGLLPAFESGNWWGIDWQSSGPGAILARLHRARLNVSRAYFPTAHTSLSQNHVARRYTSNCSPNFSCRRCRSLREFLICSGNKMTRISNTYQLWAASATPQIVKSRNRYMGCLRREYRPCVTRAFAFGVTENDLPN